ncbi:MAG: hypothetical protein EBZ48_01030 [Proteobacteria bacterium]|nr:hypothetical protein [Pseudomonadota bacterium]
MLATQDVRPMQRQWWVPFLLIIRPTTVARSLTTSARARRVGPALWNSETAARVRARSTIGRPVPRRGSRVSSTTIRSWVGHDPAYRVDARRCVSYLTIEKRGTLSEAESAMVGEWIFGCDVCQEVCPFNHRAHTGIGPIVRKEFLPEQGVGPLLEIAPVLRIRSGREFEQRFGHTALMRTRRAGLLRNAAVVAANTMSTTVFGALAETAREDPSPTVRRHCAAAMCVLHPALSKSDRSAARTVLEHLLNDPDAGVAEEARQRLGAWG